MNPIGIHFGYWTQFWDSDPIQFVERDYRGAVVMEPFLLPGGDVGRDISVFRDLLGDADLDDEATLSVQFVRTEQGKI